MKARLMHPDRDFDPQRALPAHTDALRSDLALDTLLAVMAGDDVFIGKIAWSAIANAPGDSVEAIRYRQAVLGDVLAHPEIARDLYAIATEALEEKRKSWWGFTSEHPSSILYSAQHAMRGFLDKLRSLRGIAEAHAGEIRSDGLRNLFAMLRSELDDAWLAQAAEHLDELKFSDGMLVSARLGPACESTDYVLRRPHDRKPGWWRHLLEHAPSAYTVRIAQRDLVGAKTLGEMRDRSISDVANALAQSVDHIQGFFEKLRAEVAFHVGCVNLHGRFAAKGIPTCFPELLPVGEAGFRARGLRDASLALALQDTPVANDVEASGKHMLVITGANQGGKSTFLRSFGLALSMLQAGMFVAAEALAAAPFTGLFTHYKREEDATMRQGKLDEELIRIGAIADAIRPGAWLLCNESFASTNEREGSELARQTIEAMLERGIRVVCVTHLYTFARDARARHPDDALFLRAERRPDGTRTYRLAEGAPRETSYGADLYREIFVDDTDTGETGPPARTTPPDDDKIRTAQANR